MTEVPTLRANPSRLTDLVVVRHGQTDYNAIGRLQGWDPVPLNDQGRKQVQDAADVLVDFAPTAIMTSPVLRAVQTAEIIAAAVGYDADRIAEDEGFGEFRMGDYKGELIADLRSLPTWRSYIERPHETTFPNGESLRGIYERVVQALNRAVLRDDSERLIVATHGGIARLTILAALGAPLASYHRVSMGNAGVTWVRLRSGRPPRLQCSGWTRQPVGGADLTTPR